jgi:hypothetical protein
MLALVAKQRRYTVLEYVLRTAQSTLSARTSIITNYCTVSQSLHFYQYITVLGPNQQLDIFTSSTFYSAIRLSEPFGTVGGGRGLNWAPKARLRFGVGVELCKRK